MLQLYLRLYQWRAGLRIVDSEEVSKSISKEEVACLEAQLDSRTRIVKGLGGGSEDKG